MSNGKALSGTVVALVSCFLLAQVAQAAPLTTPGEGAGQTSSPGGLAVDLSSAEPSSGNLYVADEDNNRVDVFDEAGEFAFAFGWKVDAEAPEEQLQTCTAATGCLKGTAGAGAGQLSGPTSVAVDSSTHSVYVTDLGNGRIEKFDSEGNFLFAFGAGEFLDSTAMFASVGPGGIVHVADTRVIEGVLTIRLRKYEPSGGPHVFEKDAIATGELRGGLAVDSGGNAYIRGFPANEKSFDFGKFDPSGNLLFEFSTLEENGVTALAVSPIAHLFLAGLDNEFRVIVEYDPAGNALRRFGYGLIHNFVEGLAVHSSGGEEFYFFSEGDIVQSISPPSPGPFILPGPCEALTTGSASAELNAEVNPEGKVTTYHFEYVDDATFKEDEGEPEGGFEHATRAPANPLNDPVLDPIPRLHDSPLLVQGLTPETKYHCRVLASNEDNEAGVVGEEGTFETRDPFEILASWTTDVGPETAMLKAEVNSLGLPAKGRFEYLDQKSFEDAGGFAGPNLRVSEEIDFGAGEDPVVRGAKILGLKPGTTYRYRLLVENETVAPRSGEELSFRTFSLPPEEVPDLRRYEMVSPALKNNADVAAPTNAGGGSAIQATSPDGDTVTFASFTAFGDPQSAPGFSSQYLARRSPAGWLTESINLFGRVEFSGVSYRGFTPDLRFAATSSLEPSLTDDCQSGVPVLYWRDSETGALRCVINEVPSMPAGVTICEVYAGATADGGHVFFAANGSLAGAPKAKGFSLYEWSEAGGIELISKLPGEAPAAPQLRTGFGPGPEAVLANACQMTGNLHNVISADGQRVFWTFATPTESKLLARIDGNETIQLDSTQGGVGPSGGGSFWAASSDGSEVFFTDPHPLVPDASGGEDLYRYDFEAPLGERIENLTPGSLTPGSEAAGVAGLLGTSEDGLWTYFAANGVLTDEEENPNGEKARPGSPNLYLWHEGEGVRFVASLSSDDKSDWSPTPSLHSARVTPDGRHLAFISTITPSGYDNEIEGAPGCEVKEGDLGGTNPRCAEAYLYDAEDEELSCVSCNPSGERPLGPASLPGWRNLAEGPRYLSDDGSRLFFQTLDSLVAEDGNKAQDVYEFERPGAGSCGAQSAAFVEGSGGCLYLISSGRNTDPSYLIDASSDALDVFLSTRRALLPNRDKDERYDVYDYRVGGGFPDPPQPTICPDLEACRPQPEPSPGFSSPATESFQEDLAKPKPRQCPKGKHRVSKKGKSSCVKRRSSQGSRKKGNRHGGRGQR